MREAAPITSRGPTRMTAMTRLLSVCALFIVWTVGLAALGPLPVSAHGVGGTEREILVGPAGPFEVTVRSTSSVGDVHVTAIVTELGTGVGVTDAEVLISLRDQESRSKETGPHQRMANAPGSSAYVAALSVEEPGARTITGLITSETISGEGRFEVMVAIGKPGSTVNWGLIVVLVGLLVFAVWPLVRHQGWFAK